MSNKQLIQEPINGLFNSEVNVGDRVIVITTGWGSANIRRGKYLGYILGDRWYPKKARIEIESTRDVYRKPDGSEFDWDLDYNRETWEDVQKTLTIHEEPYVYNTTLNLNRITKLES